MSVNTPFWLAIWIVAIEAIVVTILIPGDWTAKVIARESELIRSHLGERGQHWVQDRASRWYTASLIDTGLLQVTHDHLIPTEVQKARSRGLEKMGEGWFTWVEGRIEATANAYYHVLSRFALMLNWLPFLLILLVPAIFDGLTSWRIKGTNFAYSSPVLHQYSVKLVGLIAATLVGLFIAPIVLAPTIIPAAVMIAFVMMGLMTGNLQKRL